MARFSPLSYIIISPSSHLTSRTPFLDMVDPAFCHCALLRIGLDYIRFGYCTLRPPNHGGAYIFGLYISLQVAFHFMHPSWTWLWPPGVVILCYEWVNIILGSDIALCALQATARPPSIFISHHKAHTAALTSPWRGW